jgi:hypothetical protein
MRDMCATRLFVENFQLPKPYFDEDCMGRMTYMRTL